MKNHFTLLFLLVAVLPAQHQFPLQVGNTWQYYSRQNRNGTIVPVYGWTETVKKDTILPNGKTYALLSTDKGKQNFLRQEGPAVFQFISPDTERVLYHFTKTVGDTVSMVPFADDSLYCTVTSDQTITLFSQQLRRQTFRFQYVHKTEPQYHDVVSGFGVVKVVAGPFPANELTGAIINGSVYGSITAVGEQNTPGALPTFILRQNFPNPFNSSTFISFSLPVAATVSFTVWNTIGREISRVEGKQYPAGEQTIRWEGSGYPTGVYFYRISTEGSSIVKKFTLLR